MKPPGDKRRSTEEHKPPDLEDPKLFDIKMTRRDVIKLLFATAGAVFLGDALLRLLRGGCGRSHDERLMAGMVDVTDLVKSADSLDSTTIVQQFEARLNKTQQRGWQDARAQKGWDGERLKDLFVSMNDSDRVARRATREAVGVEFGFEKFTVFFDKEMGDVYSNPDPVPTLSINPLASTPDEVTPTMGKYTIFHEDSHILTTAALRAQEKQGLNRTPYFNFDELPQQTIGREYMDAGDLNKALIEVMVDKLGLRLSEQRNGKGDYLQHYAQFTRREIRFFNSIFDTGRVVNMPGLAEIAGMHAFANYAQDTTLSAELDELSKRCISGLANGGYADYGRLSSEYGGGVRFLTEVAEKVEFRRQQNF
ncbi:MAG: hypothetical protein V1744_02260 [Candidatus Altiarchaeota archaeon]